MQAGLFDIPDGQINVQELGSKLVKIYELAVGKNRNPKGNDPKVPLELDTYEDRAVAIMDILAFSNLTKKVPRTKDYCMNLERS